MQRPLQEHLLYLETRIEELKKKLRDNSLAKAEKETAQIDLGIAERALIHFQKAFELEQKLVE